MTSLGTLVIKATRDRKRKIPTVYDNDFGVVGIDGLIKAQTSIRWRLFWDGCLSIEWEWIQQRYLKWIGSDQTGGK